MAGQDGKKGTRNASSEFREGGRVRTHCMSMWVAQCVTGSKKRG